MRVRLERPSLRREGDFLDAVRRSRRLHGNYVVAPSTPTEYRDYLRRSRRDNQESFFVVLADGGELAGVVNINHIIRYSLLSAVLGYYAFVPYAGAGLMREGLALALDFAFGPLGLHRLEANIQPSNKRSKALVAGLGFRLEGVALRYLKIGGRWRDHERWAILADEWPGSAALFGRQKQASRRSPATL
ncbi:MAG TPA: GNAT family protein [Gammaproteobacteria bacterium]